MCVDEVAQVLGFSSLPGHQAVGGNFCQALRFGGFYEQHTTFDFKKSKQRVAHSLKILISAL